MKHADAAAALQNKYLMELFDQIETTADSNFMGSDYSDSTGHIISKAQRATIRLLREELEEACKVHK